NTMPVDLVAHVTVHRRFEGFGWPTVAVGKLLPAVVDPNTKQIAVEDSGEGYRFVVGGSGPLVDRGPELEAASRLFERWAGGRCLARLPPGTMCTPWPRCWLNSTACWTHYSGAVGGRCGSHRASRQRCQARAGLAPILAV